jgi:hypothetical protein
MPSTHRRVLARKGLLLVLGLCAISALIEHVLDESFDAANAAMATRLFAGLPLGVLTTADPAKSEYLRQTFARQKALAASSERGIMPVVHGVHSQLLNDPVAVGYIVDLIGTIADEVRADAAKGVNGSLR